jgi:hypothetical protein
MFKAVFHFNIMKSQSRESSLFCNEWSSLLDQFDAEIEASDLPWLLTFCDPSDEAGNGGRNYRKGVFTVQLLMERCEVQTFFS